jgi:nucleoside-diphosphate-sugar epimerase
MSSSDIGGLTNMRVFVTGASGWIGSAVVPELIAAGHQVLGLARSDTSAELVTRLGAEVHRGDLDDPDDLRRGAAACDGVVHLAYDHDFSDMVGAARTDLAAIEALGGALVDTGGPLVIASGVVGLAQGRVATEADRPDPGVHPRVAGAQAALALTERGVRPVVVRLPPTVHGEGDHGFIGTLVDIARQRGVAGYVDAGANRWPAVHRLDAATLIRIAVDRAPAGTAVHATAEEGIPTRPIAEAIGRGLGLPVASIPNAEAPAHFGWIGRFFAADVPTSSEATRRDLAWTPTHPTLIDDLDAGYYF